tara:strand:+ start:195718 stop:195843 length:126 start_codon:yes stop_codon:yes gene_type:complete
MVRQFQKYKEQQYEAQLDFAQQLIVSFASIIHLLQRKIKPE